ncbi:hypothetical protein HOY34_13665 [Xinfangfangia sp. D13-10-4-6]|uniref:hypothetical protein n=1 Tax=Pseudogemmobacter hezensis TaxID=2737662 RepID=UPI001551C4CC|nr:hypothetical protein [Pseudogemmobacter hezensis]NPD16244.1 hypothetical protein [Pseudogemmobacter hezensis]
MDDMVYAAAAALPLIAGFSVGRRFGLMRGILAGAAVFAVAVLVLVGMGYGY